MLTRRTFLQTSLAVLTIPAVGGAGAVPRSAGTAVWHIFSSGGCSDSRRFQKKFPDTCESVGTDAGACLRWLARDRGQGKAMMLCGLTRDSDAVLIGHLAAERGLTPVYQGRHHYTPAGLQHDVRGSGENLTGLQAAILHAGADWPGALAYNLASLIESRGLERRRLFTLPVTRPEDSPGYLVSWVYRKV